MSNQSLTAHTVKAWRAKGYYCEVTEHTARYGRTVRKHDLLGFCDVIAINDEEIVFLQVTSRSNMASRKRKIVSEGTVGKGQHTERIRHVVAMLLSFDHVRVVIEGWDFDEEKWRWRVRQEEVTLDDVTWKREVPK